VLGSLVSTGATATGAAVLSPLAVWDFSEVFCPQEASASTAPVITVSIDLAINGFLMVLFF
jgi:hypothetical protein